MVLAPKHFSLKNNFECWVKLCLRFEGIVKAFNSFTFFKRIFEDDSYFKGYIFKESCVNLDCPNKNYEQYEGYDDS